ncbi:MAG: 3-phosphoshikimate 1-carboxyvinyltransferase, partial [Treponema sp.]|nr:3-phosphoshikimate 1-carboxyvinyltransferase [Treponema sp.]
MDVIVEPRRFTGTVRIPASKSHTIRRLLIASLGEGVSEIDYPLDSLDARSCTAACRALGAVIEEHWARDPSCPNPADREG